MNYKNRKIVVFFLQNVQKPMAIKAGDMVPVGVQTMFAVTVISPCDCPRRSLRKKMQLVMANFFFTMIGRKISV